MEREKNGPGRNGEGRGYEVTVERFPHLGIPCRTLWRFVCKALLFLFFSRLGVVGGQGWTVRWAAPWGTREDRTRGNRTNRPIGTHSQRLRPQLIR